jgi:hypothetical protein
MIRYNMLPLRFRPPEALLLAERFVAAVRTDNAIIEK